MDLSIVIKFTVACIVEVTECFTKLTGLHLNILIELPALPVVIHRDESSPRQQYWNLACAMDCNTLGVNLCPIH